MEPVGYSAIAFTPTGKAILFLDNGKRLVLTAAQGERLVNDRAEAGLPPIPVVEPPALTGGDALADSDVQAGSSRRGAEPVELPSSAIAEPLVLWAAPGSMLTCERVIPYADGFEIELRASGAALRPPERPPERRSGRGFGRFSGLQLTVGFADGRSRRIDDLTDHDRQGPVTVSPFLRRSSGEDALWLWVMPLPPDGPVRLEATWPSRGIERAGAEIPGALLGGG